MERDIVGDWRADGERERLAGWARDEPPTLVRLVDGCAARAAAGEPRPERAAA